MSEHEAENAQIEQRSKFKVTRNAKGDPQWEIGIVEGTADETLNTMRRQAVEQYKALEQELGVALRASVGRVA